MDKKGEKERKMEEGKNKGGNEQEREREKKKVFRLSIRSREIGPWVFVGTRGKVDLRNEGYTWVPKSRVFVKAQEVGNFLTLIIF